MSRSGSNSEWKQIQKRTFTRWCNEHLKKQDTKIEDLATDFSDGIQLIVLLELLSKKSVGRYNKKPRIVAQRMENVQLALEFITKTEGIHLVNIGAGDITKGNLKLVLGLIWTLILHYQISVRLEADGVAHTRKADKYDEVKKADRSGDVKKADREVSPKKALLQWIQRKLPDKKVTNFTKDWNDGTLIAALVDAIAPGLCPEHDAMDPQNALQNAAHAMQIAEDWLNVPQLLSPEDMTSLYVDELSMMTYLSQYPYAQLKPGAPLSKSDGDPSKVKVYGLGVGEEELDTDLHSADFVVDMRDTAAGNIEVTCIGPIEPVDVTVTDNGDGTYKCSYKPKDVGKHEVHVYYNEKPAAQSPYTVTVAPGGVQMAMVGRLAEQLANMMVDAFNVGSGGFDVDLGVGFSADSAGQENAHKSGEK